MRQFFCCYLQMLSTADTIDVNVLYLQCSVPCHVNLLARTVFESIFFLHKLTSISRQNWSWEEIPSSQNSDKAASFSSVVVNKNIASSVWKSTTVNHFAIKSRCLTTIKSFPTFKIINSRIFLYYKKVLTQKLGKTPSWRQRFCFAIYSPPSAVNITSRSEVANQSDCLNHQDHWVCIYWFHLVYTKTVDSFFRAL